MQSATTLELVKKRNEHIVEMKRSGQTTTRIAHYYGLSIQRVSEILRVYEYERALKSVYTPNRPTLRPAEYPCGIRVGELNSGDGPETCAGKGCYMTYCPAYLNYKKTLPVELHRLTGNLKAAMGHAHGTGNKR